MAMAQASLPCGMRHAAAARANENGSCNQGNTPAFVWDFHSVLGDGISGCWLLVELVAVAIVVVLALLNDGSGWWKWNRNGK
jgi:hypothetical protein